MAIIEQIKAEIERLYNGEAPKHDQQCNFDDGYFTGIDAIAQFIDTLESEKPMNQEGLDQEIIKCWQNWLSPSNQKEVEGVLPKTEFAMYARHFAQWQKEQDEMSKVNYEGARAVYNNTVQHLQEKIDEKYELGKKDMREQMLKEAVEADVNIYRDLAAGKSWAEFVVEMPTNNLGDKVRIIVVKKD